MRILLTFIGLLIFCGSVYGQPTDEVYVLESYDFQTDQSSFSNNSAVGISQKKKLIRLGDSTVNIINIYGSSLIIERKEELLDGRILLTLRRQDGNNFYGKYPIVKAKINRVTDNISAITNSSLTPTD
ncbi:hypothetical protein [Spongiimicrobium sp. 3-5]|uniref:hypothetical protein n=1 Tax=Spongiimicrobium sp. 3-5 TaxID=3332596 RepID=UPI003981358C